MKRSTRLLASSVVLALLGQTACYNTYFIDKDELSKLESSVEPREVVDVYGDCPTTGGGAPAAEEAEEAPEARYRILGDQNLYAQNDAGAQEEGGDVATDATEDGEMPIPADKQGCERVPVSTANSVKVIGVDDTEYRVTPFNFTVAEQQLISPEYDLRLPLNEVEGAEVKQFSTWKTVATIVGVTAVSVGSFVAISAAAGGGGGFEN